MPDPQPMQAGNLGAALGLSPNFAPMPFGWRFAKVQAMTPAGLETLHVIVFDTVCGTVAVACNPDDFRKFCDQATEQLTGLTVARASHPANGHGPVLP